MASLSNCCVFLSLRTGSLTAAVITGLYSFFGAVMLMLTWTKVTSDEDMLLLDESGVDHDSVAHEAGTIFAFVLFVGWFITSMLLLFGITRCKPKLVMSWVICTSVILCVACLGFVSILYRSFSDGGHLIQSVILTAIQLVFLFYLLLVVISYKQVMPTCLAQYTAVAYTIPGNPYHPCEMPPKYEA